MMFTALLIAFGIVNSSLLCFNLDNYQKQKDDKKLKPSGNRGTDRQTSQVRELNDTKLATFREMPSSEGIYSSSKRKSRKSRKSREIHFDFNQMTDNCRVNSLEDFYDLDTLSILGDLAECSKHMSCEGNCGQVITTFMEYRCQCDDLCWLNGDCCFDYFKLCLDLDIRAGDQAFLETILSRFQNYTQVMDYHMAVQWVISSTCRLWVSRGVSFVDKCAGSHEIATRFQDIHKKINSPGEKESQFFRGMPMGEIRERCENFDRYSDKNKMIIDVVPVTFQLRNNVFHFLNVFCSLCNGIPVDGVTYYESYLVCQGEDSVRWTFISYPFAINSSDVTSNWTCSVKSTLPQVGRTNCFHQPVRCDGQDQADGKETTQGEETVYTSSKNSSLSKKYVSKLCSLYQLVFSDYLAINVYKNPFCYHCYHANKMISNNNNNNASRCRYICMNRFLPVIPMSGFTLLFDFRSREKLLSVDNTDEVPHHFARSLKKSKIICKNGFVLFARKCVRSLYWHQKDSLFNLNISLKTVGLKFILLRQKYFNIGLSTRQAYILQSRSCDQCKYQNTNVSGDDRLRDKNRGNVFDERSKKYVKYSIQRLTDIWVSNILRDFVKPLTTAVKEFTEIISNTVFKRLRAGFNESLCLQKDEEGFVTSGEKCIFLQKMPSLQHLTDTENISVTQFFDFNTKIYELKDALKNDVIIILHFLDPSYISALVTYLTELLPALVAIGHSKNFKVLDIKLSTLLTKETNRLLETSCIPGRELTLTSVPITLNTSGDYVVEVDEKEIPSGDLDFEIILSVNQNTGDDISSRLVLPLCKGKSENLTTLQCLSSVYLYFSLSDYILFNGFLIVSSNEHVIELLKKITFEIRNDSIIEVLRAAKPEEEFYVYDNNTYILIDAGAIVCSTSQMSHDYSIDIKSRDSKVLVYKDVSLVERYLSLASSLLTIVSLTLVLVVYGVLSELRQNVPGKIILSLSVSLLLAHIMFLFSHSLENLACEIYSLIHHAVWLASFAWLAFMAAHLAYTLKFSSAETDNASVFYKISIICWGVPSVWASACFTFDKTNLISMSYGRLGPCWIGDDTAMLFTFGVPVFVCLTTSLTCSFIVIHSISKSVQFRRRSSTNVGNERNQLILCFNLCLLMALGWVAYFIVLVADIPYLWILHDFAHGCEGLFILLCFVTRRSILTKLIFRMRNTQ